MPAPRANWRRRKIQGVVIASATPAPNATLEQKLLYSRQVYQIIAEASRRRRTSSRSTRRARRSPAWCSSRGTSARRTTNQLQPLMQQRAQYDRRRARRGVPAAAAARQPGPAGAIRDRQPPSRSSASTPSRRSSCRRPSKAACSSFSTAISRSTSRSRLFEIDRNKAAQLGLKMSDVGSALGWHAGRRLRQLFQPRPALLQGDPAGASRPPPERPTTAQLLHRHRQRRADPAVDDRDTSRPRRCRNRSTISSSSTARPSRALRRLAWRRPTRWSSCRILRARTLPQGYAVDYGGLSRQYVQESSGFIVTFGFALIIIFLALAALFESFRDPLIILVSVPMSIAGALAVHQRRHRRREPEHLYRGRPGDLDGADQQARHPDRRIRQRRCSSKASPSARRSRRPPESGCGRS